MREGCWLKASAGLFRRVFWGPSPVWCVREDPFHDAAQDLTNKIGAVGSFEHGEHNGGYWRRVLPGALRFIGSRL